MLKRIVSLLLIFILLMSAVPYAAASDYPDVTTAHWAYREIREMTKRGVIQGSGGMFYPSGDVSRQAFLSMVCRASGLDDRTLEQGADWWKPLQAFAHYFNWCSDTEINEFNRAQPITRELAAKLLVKAFYPDQISDSRSAVFADRDQITAEYLPYTDAAFSLGLISGYEDGTFRPQGTLTRAAAAAIISRALSMQTQSLGETVQIPILMYHDVSYLGYDYSKAPEIFRKQMEELKQTGFNTVFFSQVIDFVDNGTPLPEKPIVITFDDGYMTNYTYVLPILQELNMKAEISLIGGAMEYSDWGLKWDMVQEMQESGLVRFQAHTYNLHDVPGRTGVLKTAKESWPDYVRMFTDDTRMISSLLTRKTGHDPQVFTYPLGKHNPVAEAVVRRLGFRASLTTKDGVTRVTCGNPESLYLMDRIGMDFRNGSVTAVLRQFGYQT